MRDYFTKAKIFKVPSFAIILGFLILTVLIPAGVVADAYVGGEPLVTVQNGIVSGDLWIDANPPSWGPLDVTKSFTLPATAVEQPGRITWARLYVAVYCGHMQQNKHGNATISLDAAGDGTFETQLGVEDLNVAYSYPFDGGNGTVTVNDHCNRVTSDYLMWYNVTTYLTSKDPAIRVITQPVGASGFDGRIKEIALVVAYNDGDSDTVRYWVNQGHDACTYYMEDTYDSVAVGNTTFATAGISGFTSANLTAIYMASINGNYGFPTEANTFVASTKTGNFTNLELDRIPDIQGPYSGVKSWNVTASVTGSDVKLGYARNLGGSGTAAFFKIPLAVLTTREPAPPADLQVTAIAYNPSAGNELFANEANIIRATVKNNGTGNAGSFDVRLNASGYIETKRLSSGLAAGAQTTVDFTGFTPASASSYLVNVTADPGSEVSDLNPLNNSRQESRTVYYNGYKGKRWTAGGDMNTRASFEGAVNLLYSFGNAAYAAAGWTTNTTNWTLGDLPVPAGASIISARLYQAYTFDQTPGGLPNWTATFDEVSITPDAVYTDRKGFATYNYPSGLVVYNVTDLFSIAGDNTFTLNAGIGNNNGLYGPYLVVVFRKQGEPERKIWINDECDILYAGTARSASDEEATTYANFTGVGTQGITNATLVAVLPSANEVDKSRFYFNNQEFSGFWTGYKSSPQVSFAKYDVKGALAGGTNTARLQSRIVSGSGDNMVATNTFLIVESTSPVSITTISPTSGLPGSSVSATIIGTNFTAGSVVNLTHGSDLIPGTNVVITGNNKITCKFKIPAGTPTSAWDLFVTNNLGFAKKASAFFVLAGPVPSVSTLTPNTMYPNTTWTFTLAGNNFQTGANVTFTHATYGQLAATATVTNPKKITGTLSLPLAGTTGMWDLTVTNPDGGTTTKKNALNVKPWVTPGVTSLQPTTVLKNATTSLVLNGRNFQPGLTTVFFNLTGKSDIPLTNLTVISPTKITGTVSVPGGSVEGKWNAVVTTADGGTGVKRNALTIKPWMKPGISTVMPTKAFTNSTVSFTIGGSNFQDGATVFFNRTGSPNLVPDSYTLVSTKKITGTLTIPPGTATDKWNLVVTTPDGGTTVKSKAFQIAPWSKPTIGTITPRSGTMGTPVSFTLTGTNFQPDATVVVFNKTGSADIPAADVTVTSPTRLTGNVTLPATGKWNLVVSTVDGGASAKKNNAFTVT